eukprot:CAMPEP_0181486030 /NCGR_PEP_ID=MMETSP1110-20121109/46892_1 /TAXON_ID=174948 /ORGANISM="Symbiodinium sp., Strain CCMP421" /LENGTH=118 /DNA_ID=CAMNT_0023612091 /DNA_START=53 /DNA_END=406 /DNA_ORIENTATION=+
MELYARSAGYAAYVTGQVARQMESDTATIIVAPFEWAMLETTPFVEGAGLSLTSATLLPADFAGIWAGAALGWFDLSGSLRGSIEAPATCDWTPLPWPLPFDLPLPRSVCSSSSSSAG